MALVMWGSYTKLGMVFYIGVYLLSFLWYIVCSRWEWLLIYYMWM